MFRSIKSRLTFTICGILLFVFFIQMAANFLLADQFYINQKMKMLTDVYHKIDTEFNNSDYSLEYIIRNLYVDRNLEFYIADQNMNIIYTNKIQPPNLPPMDDKSLNFDFRKYPASYYKTSEPTLLKTDMQDMDRIRLISKFEKGGNSYYLAIRLSVQSISDDMKSTNIFILYISGIAIIAGALIVYFISRQFAKPIEDINKVAIHISKLDFSDRARETRRKDEIGSLARNINIMSDRLEENIINLQEANKKLEFDNKYMSEVDEQRKELIANISHELKTPLAILTGYSEMLSNDVPGIDKAFYYETIQDETSKMDILIKTLLNLSDLENSLINLNLEKISIVELTEKIYRKSILLMEEKGIVSELHTKPCGDVMADPLYIELAVNNYLSNAIQYTEPGHKIIVKAEPLDDEVMISVFNEGVKIDEAHMQKIWNSFYREDKSRTRTPQNNIGLGLYIVRTIMNAHHGKCGVMNKEGGVEFWLSIKTVR